METRRTPYEEQQQKIAALHRTGLTLKPGRVGVSTAVPVPSSNGPLLVSSTPTALHVRARHSQSAGADVVNENTSLDASVEGQKYLVGCSERKHGATHGRGRGAGEGADHWHLTITTKA